MYIHINEWMCLCMYSKKKNKKFTCLLYKVYTLFSGHLQKILYFYTHTHK